VGWVSDRVALLFTCDGAGCERFSAALFERVVAASFAAALFSFARVAAALFSTDRFSAALFARVEAASFAAALLLFARVAAASFAAALLSFVRVAAASFAALFSLARVVAPLLSTERFSAAVLARAADASFAAALLSFVRVAAALFSTDRLSVALFARFVAASFAAAALPLGATTPLPVNSPGRDVAATDGLPWFTEFKSSWFWLAAC